MVEPTHGSIFDAHQTTINHTHSLIRLVLALGHIILPNTSYTFRSNYSKHREVVVVVIARVTRANNFGIPSRHWIDPFHWNRTWTHGCYYPYSQYDVGFVSRIVGIHLSRNLCNSLRLCDRSQHFVKRLNGCEGYMWVLFGSFFWCSPTLANQNYTIERCCKLAKSAMKHQQKIGLKIGLHMVYLWLSEVCVCWSFHGVYMGPPNCVHCLGGSLAKIVEQRAIINRV